jgi:ABC-2 type transport system permease protein
MSTTTTVERDAVAPQAPAPAWAGTRVSQARVVVSEWIKLRSLRSTVISMVLALVALVGIGLLASAIASGNVAGSNGRGPGRDAADPTALVLSGAGLVQIIVGVLGVLVVTSEYSSGMIRATLAAVPKRLPVLWAKLLVTGAVTLVVTLVGSVVAFFAGQAVLGRGTHATSAIGDPGVLRAVLGTAVVLTAVALLGTALGAVLRSTAGAIASLLGLLLLVPGLATLLLPSSWQNDVTRLLPSEAGSAFTSVTPASGALSPWVGLAVLAAWVVVAVAAAAVRLLRTDA